MTGSPLWLVAAGVGGGLIGSMAGLASLVSYPALLAAGLSPLSANVTNTVALFGVTGGTVLGSQRELHGQRSRILPLCTLSVCGGAAGAALLLLTPAGAFEAVVPWLVGLGAVLLSVQDRIPRSSSHRRPGASQSTSPGVRLLWALAIGLVGLYAGYFGAGAGIIALAVLGFQRDEGLAVTNAVKNVVTGTANAVAAICYAFFAPVDWSAAACLGVGAVLGGLLGPRVVRVAPERPLRWIVAVAGLALAVHLATR